MPLLILKNCWTSQTLCGICLYCKGGADMEQYTIEEIYAGDKYHVMSDVMQEFFHKGRPVDYDTKTWLDMLIVKHSISVAEKMLKEGDSVSGMFDNESSSSYVSWEDTSDEND